MYGYLLWKYRETEVEAGVLASDWGGSHGNWWAAPVRWWLPCRSHSVLGTTSTLETQQSGTQQTDLPSLGGDAHCAKEAGAMERLQALVYTALSSNSSLSLAICGSLCKLLVSFGLLCSILKGRWCRLLWRVVEIIRENVCNVSTVLVMGSVQ